MICPPVNRFFIAVPVGVDFASFSNYLRVAGHVAMVLGDIQAHDAFLHVYLTLAQAVDLQQPHASFQGDTHDSTEHGVGVGIYGRQQPFVLGAQAGEGVFTKVFELRLGFLKLRDACGFSLGGRDFAQVAGQGRPKRHAFARGALNLNAAHHFIFGAACPVFGVGFGTEDFGRGGPADFADGVCLRA